MIKGVFFDLGGTLYHYGEGHSEMSDLVLELRHRLGVDDGEHEEHMQLFAQANKEADHAMAQKPFFLFRDYFKLTYQGFIDCVGVDYDEAHFQWYYQQSARRFTNEMNLMPGCFETLDALRTKGLYLSIVSNIDDDMFSVLLNKDGIYKKVDHCTSSEEAQSCKPDQRFFQVALQKSALQPSEVIFVGDSLEQDILGAHQAGMHTVLLDINESSHAPMHVGRETVEPDYCIRQLSELPDLIEKF